MQGRYGSMLVTKKGKLHINIHQVDNTEWVHTLWPMKFCPKAGVSLFSLTCKLLQGNKITSDHRNSIVVKSSKGNIILDHPTETHDGWVAKVQFPAEQIKKGPSQLLLIRRKILMTYLFN